MHTEPVGGKLAIFFVLTVSMLLTAATAADAGRSSGGWTTLYPVRQPVTLSLPVSWQTEAPSGLDEVFFSQSPDTLASVEILVSSYQGSPATFAADMSRRARAVYLAQDPKARVRSRTITRPEAGLEVITSLVRRENSKAYPLSVESYAYLHHGKIYEFVYLTLTPKIGTYYPVFARSAGSIRFKS